MHQFLASWKSAEVFLNIRIVNTLVAYIAALTASILTTHTTAASPCDESGATATIDFTYCQLANQLNKPARWVDGIFADKGQNSQGKMSTRIVFGNNLYPDSSFDTFTAIHARIKLPNLEDKFRIEFTSSQNSAPATSTSGSASNTAGVRSAVSAVFSPKLGSVQLGIGWSLQNNLVVLAQASLPIQQTIGKNQIGLIPRALWNKDDDSIWVAQLYWDHNYSPNFMTGWDNTVRYRVADDWLSNTVTFRSRFNAGNWTYQTTLATQWLEDPISDNRTQWVRFSGEHTLGRPWLKAQIVPAVFWDEANGYKVQRQISFNIIADINS